MIFSIPWGHHKLIIDKCGMKQNKALFYVRQIVQNNWSRATLPPETSELAQEITKDPYSFDFLTLTTG